MINGNPKENNINKFHISMQLTDDRNGFFKKQMSERMQ